MVYKQLQASEYNDSMDHLMDDCRFYCHNCCYNIPLATVIFTLLFCISITLVPAVEQYLIELQTGPASWHHTGLEFIHGIVAWLFMLATYLIASQLIKAKVQTQTSNLADVQHICLISHAVNGSLAGNHY